MKKILFINASLSSGGSEKVMVQLANGLVNKGLDISMILLRKKEKVYRVDKKINLIEFEYINKIKLLMLIERIYKLRKEIKKIKPHSVVAFMYDINLFTLISCIGLPVKIIISERNHPLVTGDGSKKRPLISRLMVKLLYPLSDKIVFQTEFAKECFDSKIKKKGVIIPNPLYLREYSICENKEKKIVAVGRFVKQKNFSLLLRVYARILKDYSDYKLYLYGKGELEGELRELVKELNIESNVIFKGFVSNLPYEISDAQLYVSTSNFEGISNAMLEALGVGIPCICTNCPVGGAALVIEDGINGFLIPIKDELLLEVKMRKLLGDSDLRNSFSQEAIKVREKYNLEKICEKWIEII